MSSPESPRIDALENRIDRLEVNISNDLRRIFDKLEALTLDTTRNACPSPGACVGLSKELENQIRAHNATMLRVERLEIQLIELHQERAKLVGIWTAIAFIASLLGGAFVFVVGKLWNPAITP
jgi:chromosome segregation ATPase